MAVGTDNPTNKSYTVEVSINSSLVAMKVDTAADYSIMSKSTYTLKFSNFPLYPSNVELKTYTAETLIVCGEIQCNVLYEGHEYTLPIIVANYDNKPTLLDRNWLNRIKLAWGEIFGLTRSGLLKLKRSPWVRPIVVVPKADKSVRICGDYKITINSAVEDEQYPLPTQQDLVYAALSG